MRRARRRWRNLRHAWCRTDWERLRGFLATTRGARRPPWRRLLRLGWRHGASPDEAVALLLLDRTDCEVAGRITQGRRHEFTVATSSPTAWLDLQDKWRFAGRFHDLLGRRVEPAPRALMLLDADPLTFGPEVFIKRRFGQVSGGQRFLAAAAARELLSTLDRSGRAGLVVEAPIVQHPELDRILPGLVFSVRLITFLDADGVEIWPAQMRLGSGELDAHGHEVRSDSLGAIIVAVGADGRLARDGRVRDPAAPRADRHPVSGTALSDIVVPYFDEAADLVRRAARRVPGVRSVGWDVAITPSGPVLIEGNHNWSSFVLEVASPRSQHLLRAHVPDVVYGGRCRHCECR